MGKRIDVWVAAGEVYDCIEKAIDEAFCEEVRPKTRTRNRQLLQDAILQLVCQARDLDDEQR